MRSTVTDNHADYDNFYGGSGGGLSNQGGAVSLGLTILSGNIFGGSGTGPECAGPLISQGYNWIGDVFDCTLSGAVSNSVVGQPVYLQPLESQGGGTLVHLPLPPDNPLLDRGPTTGCPAYDQRGRTRPQDGDTNGQAACDIGAVEVQPVVSTVQSVTAPGVYNFDMGAGSGDVTMIVNQGGCLDAVTVIQQDTSHPDASSAIQSGIYWQIAGGACNSGFSLDLTLPHGGLTDPTICVLLNGVWDCARDTFDSTTVTRRNVNHFSEWTVGENPSGGVAPAVSASRSSANLLLAWPHNTANSSGYIVWYSTSPYFSPGGPDVTRVTVVAPDGYIHTGVIGNLQSLYYLVQGVGGNTIASEPSNRIGKFEFSLTPGSP